MPRRGWFDAEAIADRWFAERSALDFFDDELIDPAASGSSSATIAGAATVAGVAIAAKSATVTIAATSSVEALASSQAVANANVQGAATLQATVVQSAVPIRMRASFARTSAIVASIQPTARATATLQRTPQMIGALAA